MNNQPDDRLTPAEVESLRKDSELALKMGRLFWRRAAAMARDAPAAEICALDQELEKLEQQLKDLR